MGGGIKSHQDTVVHPMYVSYNSLPTSAGNPQTLSASLFRTNRKTSGGGGGGGGGIPVSLSATFNRRPGVECHKNFVNFNGNDNLLRNQSLTWNSCNVKAGGGGGGAASVTGLATTEQETTVDEFPNYFPPAPIMALSPDSRNKPFQDRKMNQRKSMVDGGEVSFYSGSEPVDDLIDLQPYQHGVHGAAPTTTFNDARVPEIEGDTLPEYNSFNRANILVNQRLKHGGFYKMSGDFIPRSPNFSQSGSRRRNLNNNAPRNMNFCDQIRGPALEQMMRVGASGSGGDSNSYSPAVIQPIRTRSQTQLPVSGSLSRGGGGVRVHGEPTIHEDIIIVSSRSRHDDWRGGGGGGVSFDAVVGDADIHQKMNQMLRQKKSLRPRSYCGSNYYSEFEHVTPNFVHAPN